MENLSEVMKNFHIMNFTNEIEYRKTTTSLNKQINENSEIINLRKIAE